MFTLFTGSHNSPCCSWSWAVPCCCHPSLTQAEAISEAEDLKVILNKTDSFLLWKLHWKRQEHARTACRSPKIIWCEEQSWTEVRATWGDRPHPCRQGTWGRMQLYLQLLPIWPSDNKSREKRVIPALWFSFSRWQSLRFSELFDILPCSIVANICKTYSNSLFNLCWAVSSLGSDPPFSLFFFFWSLPICTRLNGTLESLWIWSTVKCLTSTSTGKWHQHSLVDLHNP